MDSSGGSSIKPSSGRFLQTLRPIRDLESNWEVDLAKNLEDYLLQICSGNISSQDAELFIVNFAEAALLLQGSVQVFGRKVEYLHSLVLNALDFISNKRFDMRYREEQGSGATGNPQTLKDQGDDSFWCSDEIAVDSKNMLDSSVSRDAATPRYFVRPPANLAVLEGECLEPSGDSGELESYLLATVNLYRDFLLLDPSDAVVVDDILDFEFGKRKTNVMWGSSLTSSKGWKSSQMPSRKPGRNTPKLLVKKMQDISETQSQSTNHGFDSNEGHDLRNSPEGGFEFDDDFSEPGGVDSDEDDDDPWKPLNPHEPGFLKVKPYKKVKAKKRRDPFSSKHRPSMAEFPLAKRHGLICEELNEIWEETYGKPESLSLMK
ncbi:hypothetical protein M569_13713 [Genlisea aurea]|uniref:Condensin-2 complex subunit H2 n=1 Tax=Genlisea aurea TaxID=192259 RepID=S8DE84_9LAMI|nr:hypothetical protein M569_13713 [Genlisea aurea]